MKPLFLLFSSSKSQRISYTDATMTTKRTIGFINKFNLMQMSHRTQLMWNNSTCVNSHRRLAYGRRLPSANQSEACKWNARRNSECKYARRLWNHQTIFIISKRSWLSECWCSGQVCLLRNMDHKIIDFPHFIDSNLNALTLLLCKQIFWICTKSWE